MNFTKTDTQVGKTYYTPWEKIETWANTLSEEDKIKLDKELVQQSNQRLNQQSNRNQSQNNGNNNGSII